VTRHDRDLKARDPAGSVKLADFCSAFGFSSFCRGIDVFCLMIAKPSLAIV
jgi:hypothetical protein